MARFVGLYVKKPVLYLSRVSDGWLAVGLHRAVGPPDGGAGSDDQGNKIDFSLLSSPIPTSTRPSTRFPDPTARLRAAHDISARPSLRSQEPKRAEDRRKSQQHNGGKDRQG